MAVEYKVGDKVRILDVNGIQGGSGFWRTGDLTEVTEMYMGRAPRLKPTKPCERELGNYLKPSELKYIELVTVKDIDLLFKIESLEKRVEELESKMNNTESKTVNISNHFEIKDKLDAKTFASSIIEELKKRQEKADNNQLRKQVIEEAKSLLKTNESNKQIQFLINKDKQLITCVVIDENSGKVVGQGINKSSIVEVYNEHIGKAIALCKALNINTDKYVKATLPDKIVEGHIIKNKELPDFIYTVIKRIDELTIDVKSHTNHMVYNGYSFNNKAENYFLIIEDTDVDY